VVAEAVVWKSAHAPPVVEVEIVLAGQQRGLAAAPQSAARADTRGEVATRSLLLVPRAAL